jgi:hypothetical protein
MQLVIYADEHVDMVMTEDGYRRVRVWRAGYPRLTIDTRSAAITFVRG